MLMYMTESATDVENENHYRERHDGIARWQVTTTVS